jgi:hypothetical protein
LRPKARQIREIADCDIPAVLAIDRVDQCVSWCGGFCSSVAVITRSTCSSVIVRGAPGRGSSVNPSRRSRANRDRHLRTVSRDTARPSATSVFDRPFAHSNTIRDRNANACAVVRRRIHPIKT